MASLLRPALPVLALASCALLAACSSDTGGSAADPSPTASGAASSASPAASASPTGAEWSYAGAQGPDHWGDVAETCGTTSASTQSPIDIDQLALVPGEGVAPVELAFKPTEFAVFNNGHTIEAVPQEEGAAGGFTVDGVTYTVAQFHFHDPSEHTLDGENAPMEMHIVAKAEDGKVAVLGLLLQEGEDNSGLHEVFASMPTEVTEEDEAVELATPVDLATIVPADAPLARYTGSLTTPPCTEGVLWDVYLSPATISPEQLAAFQALYPDNHRPTQPLNGREVSEATETVAGE